VCRFKKRTPSDCFFWRFCPMWETFFPMWRTHNTHKSFWSVLLISCRKKRKIVCLLSDHNNDNNDKTPFFVVAKKNKRGITFFTFSQLQLSYNLTMCVCVSVSMPKNFGAAWRAQKCLHLAEIWHTCSLSNYLGSFFFYFLRILIFGAWGPF